MELLGGLCARRGQQAITRFRTHKTGALLAFLAFHRERVYSRETLIGMHWPEDDGEAGRRKLRLALTSLRRQLELAGDPARRVILADRLTVQLNPGAVTTDVAEFEAALAAADSARGAEQIALCKRALTLYSGPLLPGYYEPWITAQMLYLEERYFHLSDQLIGLQQRAGDLDGAIETAGRALSMDPLREETHQNLMRLYAAAKRPVDVVRQYRALERLLKEAWYEAPSAETTALMKALTERVQTIRNLRSAPGMPPDTISNPPVPLPVPLTRFFGRESELTDLRTRLSPGATFCMPASRLITLTGPGGSGKTRLALEAAGLLQEVFVGAMGYVSCADLTDAARIPDTIAEALGLPPAMSREPWEQIVAALSDRSALLVLDNLEHLLPAAARIVRRLLERTPELRLLVTSRQRLGLSGEQEFPVAPLPIPTEATARLSMHWEPQTLLRCPSVQLFVDRSQLARPDFQMTRANARAIAELCDRLEGIPLAIELAAAQAQMMSPAQMLGHLARRFDFLVSRQRDVEQRHRTLRAALDWSFQLLTSEQRSFCARLSVFRGGWTVAAAAAVCGTMQEESDSSLRSSSTSVLDHLSQLRERSLILAEDAGEERRFRMLETLREYAAECLTPDNYAEAQRRHLDYFLRLAAQVERAWWTAEEETWMERLGQEHDNIRAALRWALGQDVTAALRLAGEVARYWSVRGYLREGRAWLHAVLEASEGQRTPERAWALCGAAVLARDRMDHAAAHLLAEESVHLYESLSCRGEKYAIALQRLGVLECDRHEYAEARWHVEHALEIQRALGTTRSAAVTLSALAWVALGQGDYAGARRACEESIADFHALGCRWGAAVSLYLLGLSAFYQGDPVGAQQFYTQSRQLHEAAQNRYCVGLCLLGLGAVSLRLGESAQTRMQWKAAIALFQEIDAEWGIVEAVEGLATLALAEGDAARAARLWAAAYVQRGEGGQELTPGGKYAREALEHEITAAIGGEGVRAALHAARIAPWDEAVQDALRP
jgi:predicted ATPase/DNA-binding SARP family transcriptional activator